MLCLYTLELYTLYFDVHVGYTVLLIGASRTFSLKFYSDLHPTEYQGPSEACTFVRVLSQPVGAPPQYYLLSQLTLASSPVVDTGRHFLQPPSDGRGFLPNTFRFPA